MRSKHINIRLKPDEIEKLHRYASRYDMTGTQFLKKFVLLLIDDKMRQDSEKFMKSVAGTLHKQSQELEMFTQMIADTSSKLASSVSQTTMVLNGRKKKYKKKQTFSG